MYNVQNALDGHDDISLTQYITINLTTSLQSDNRQPSHHHALHDLDTFSNSV